MFYKEHRRLPLPALHGDVLLFEIVGTLNGQTTISTFHYRWMADNSADQITEADADAAIRLTLSTPYRECLTTDWTGLVTRTFVVKPSSTVPALVTTFTPDGTVDPPTLPPTNAVCITRRASRRGPRGRGRVYLPAVPVAWTTGGLVTTTTAYTAFAEAMIDEIGVAAPAGTLTPCLWSRATDLNSTVDAYTVQSVLRSQRRRAIGVGI